MDARNRQAETKKRDGNTRTKDIFDQVGRVSTNGDHLSVRHIDHAHKTKGNGQTDGNDQQNATKAKTTEKGAAKVDLGLMQFNRLECMRTRLGKFRLAGFFRLAHRRANQVITRKRMEVP